MSNPKTYRPKSLLALVDASWAELSEHLRAEGLDPEAYIERIGEALERNRKTTSEEREMTDRMSEYGQFIAEDQAKAKAKKSGWDGTPIPIGELNKQRKDDHDPEIKAWVNRINKHLRSNGIPSTMSLSSLGDIKDVVRSEVIRRFEKAGYRLEFGDDQRDGAWLSIRQVPDSGWQVGR